MFPLPKELVRIIFGMIPLEDVDKVAQCIHHIMFAPECEFQTHHEWESDKNYYQMQIAIMHESTFTFHINVDKCNLYFQNDRRSVVGFAAGLNENNYDVDTTKNYELPLVQHIYTVAHDVVKEMEWFLARDYVSDEKVTWVDKNDQPFCKRRSLFHRDKLTFDELCEIL